MSARRVVLGKPLALAAVCAPPAASRRRRSTCSRTRSTLPLPIARRVDRRRRHRVAGARRASRRPTTGTFFTYRIGRPSRRARSVRPVRRASGRDADIRDPRIPAKRGLHPRRRRAGRRVAGRGVDRGRRRARSPPISPRRARRRRCSRSPSASTRRRPARRSRRRCSARRTRARAPLAQRDADAIATAWNRELSEIADEFVTDLRPVLMTAPAPAPAQ